MNSDEPDVDTSGAGTTSAEGGDWRLALGSLLVAASPLADPLGLIRSLVECARVHSGATAAALTVPFHDGNWVRVVVAAGGSAEWENRVLPLEGSATALAVEAGRAVLVDETTLHERTGQSARSTTTGPSVVAPAYSGGQFRGALLLSRLPGQANSAESDRGMATAFAEYLAWALLVPEGGAVGHLAPADDGTDAAARVYGHVAGSLFAITSRLCSLRSQAPEALSKSIDAAVLEADRIATSARVVASEHRRSGRDRSLDAVLSAFSASVAEHGLVGSVEFDGSRSTPRSTVDAVKRWIPGAVSIAARFGVTRAVSLDLAVRHAAGAKVIATVRYRGWLPEAELPPKADITPNSWSDANSDNDADSADDRDIALRLMTPHDRSSEQD
ncbi:hypothetical protein [Umezawaea sp.]|uniref:hypothetical protein n=1 Tax=Umezawaea sp. TaxID=1955258 RepID=UPI002ED5CD3B